MNKEICLHALCILEAFHEMPASRAAEYYTMMVEEAGSRTAHQQIIFIAEQFEIAWEALLVHERLAVIQMPRESTWIPTVIEDLALRHSHKGMFYKTTAQLIYEITLRLIDGSKL